MASKKQERESPSSYWLLSKHTATIQRKCRMDDANSLHFSNADTLGNIITVRVANCDVSKA